MKKTILLCIISALCLTACGAEIPAAAPVIYEGAQIGENAPENSSAGDAICESYWTDEDQPVSAKTEQSSFRPDTAEIRVVITNRTDAEYCFAESEFRLYRLENGREIAVPYAEKGDNFTAMAQIAPPQGTAVFTADIAAHYDMPLPEGVYIMHIGTAGAGNELTAGFEIAADAPLPEEPEQTQQVTVTMIETQYPAGTDEISVLLTNTGSETVDIDFQDFGLEHFLGQAVSYATFSREPVEHFADIRGVQLEPDNAYIWNVKLADFGETAPEPGKYAIQYRNQEAKFTIGE